MRKLRLTKNCGYLINIAELKSIPYAEFKPRVVSFLAVMTISRIDFCLVI